MKTVIKQLFEISLMHNYYANKICPDFTVIPDSFTLQLIKNFKLLYKSKVNGGSIFYQGRTFEASGASDILPLLPITNDTVFTFKIISNSSDWMTYTDIASTANVRNRPVFMFTNGNVLNAESIIIQSSGSALNNPVVILPFRTQYPVEVAAAPAMLELVDESGLVVKSYLVRGYNQSESDSLVLEPGRKFFDYVSIDLEREHISAGLYTIHLKRSGAIVAASVKNIYFSEDDFSSCMGIIRIKFKDGQLADRRQHQNFLIQFKPRAVTYKYLVSLRNILPPPTQPLTAANVDIEHATVAFTPTRDVVGRKIEFESNTQVILSEVGLKNVRLKKTGAGSTILMSNLPNPAPENIDIINNKSEIYINL